MKRVAGLGIAVGFSMLAAACATATSSTPTATASTSTPTATPTIPATPIPTLDPTTPVPAVPFSGGWGDTTQNPDTPYNCVFATSNNSGKVVAYLVGSRGGSQAGCVR